MEWLEGAPDNKHSILYQNVQSIKRDGVARDVAKLVYINGMRGGYDLSLSLPLPLSSLLSDDSEVAVDSIVQVAQKLSATQRREIIRFLSTSLGDLTAS